MTKTAIAHSLTYMFKDDDWFWKVSVGVLALFLIGLGIGYFFVIGYYVETVRRLRKDETTLPEWNRLGAIWRAGRTVGGAMLCYTAVVLGCLAAVHQSGILNAGIGIVMTHACMLPFVVLSYLGNESLRSCFAFRSFVWLIRRSGLRAAEVTAAGFAIVSIVVCFGWMALIVGWPFFIFWGMLAAAAFTASLAPSFDAHEAAVQ